MLPEKKDGGDESYLKYAQIGLELAAGVGLGFWAGSLLDARLGAGPWLSLAGSALGLAAGFYLMIRGLPEEKAWKGGKRGRPQ